MKFGDICRCVGISDICRINGEYCRIRQRHADASIGTQMMQNDLTRNTELWADIDQAVMTLFQNIARGDELKQEIIVSLRLPADTHQQLIPPPREPHSARDLLITEALAFYGEAYTAAEAGDMEAFRNQALKYRTKSGLDNGKLQYLLLTLNELSSHVELDEFNTGFLWRTYQRDHKREVKELLYQAIKNHVFENGDVYADAYMACVSAIILIFN